MMCFGGANQLEITSRNGTSLGSISTTDHNLPSSSLQQQYMENA